MSMMSPESVGLDFNIGGNYGASLAQMISQADQYARSADTMVGKISLLNVGVTSLISRTAALTGVQKVATSTAGAYQQQLAGMHATATITGQSFSSLEKSTLALGRSMGSMGSAVQTMQAVQQSGVTTEKTISSLAKSWAQLGVANQSSGIELGKSLLDLGRAFGNSEKQLQAYGDSLTATSMKYGANAQAAASFAKALAPVASSVGMTESSVIGLGVAASRLGETGYAGANAFNKVLLDMGRSIREGTPEIKTYAQMLGMTQDNLANLFKTDPTEVLLRFTEAINKGGASSMRQLEALGLDATRTVRSLQALSSQGNLRQIVQESAESYGGGSTSKAAASALDTVNHSAAQLGETLQQTVAAAGKPFLGWLNDVLHAANAIASTVNSLITSGPVQRIGQILAPVGFIGGAATSLVSSAGLAALGLTGLRAGRNALRAGSYGAELRRGGYALPEGESSLVRAGYAYGGAMPEPLFGGGGLRGLMPGANWGQRIAAVGTAGLNWASIGLDAQARLINQGFRPSVDTSYSAAGQQARSMYGAIWGTQGRAGLTAGPEGNFIMDFGKKLQASGVVAANWTKEVSTATGATTRFSGSIGRLLGSLGGAAGVVGGRAVSGLGAAAGALGFANPWMLAAGAGIAGISFVQGIRGERKANEQMIAGASGDVYGTFNAFAGAADIASKGLVSFSEQVQKTTAQLAASTVVNAQGQVGALTAEQVAQATMPGYTPALATKGVDVKKGKSAQYYATYMQAILQAQGPNPTPQAIAQAAMDVESLGGPGMGNQALALFNQQSGSGSQNLYMRMFQQGASLQNWKGTSKQTARIDTLVQQVAGQAIAQAQDTYGATGATAERIRQAQMLYDVGRQSQDPEVRRQAAHAASLLLPGKGHAEDFLSMRMQFASNASFADTIRLGASREQNRAFAVEAAKMLTPGGAVKSPLSVAEAEPAWMTTSKDLDAAMTRITGNVDELGHAMQEAAAHTRDSTQSISALGQALEDYRNDATAANRGVAASLAAQAAMRGGGGQLASAQALLNAQIAAAPNDNARDALQAAQQQLAMGGVVGQRTLGTYARIQQAITAGGIARQQGIQTDPQDEAARQATIQAEQEAYGQRYDMQKQFVDASNQLNIQLGRQAEEAAISRARTEEDYQKQVRYATEDYHRQRMIAERDFGIQMGRAAEDAAKALYDPFQRIQAQQVWDTQSLMGNIAEQNRAIVQQTSQVARLRRMGLSQQAVDTLSLTDPKNAQQVSRMLDEAVANPATLRQLNALINQRVSAARGATQNENNVDFRRQKEDFNRAMTDNSTNFRIQMNRMADAHEVALTRMTQDLARNRRNAQEDLARMFTETTGDITSVAQQFMTKVKALPGQAQAVMSTNLKLMMGSAVLDAQTEMAKLTDPASLASLMSDLLTQLSYQLGTRPRAHEANLPPSMRTGEAVVGGRNAGGGTAYAVPKDFGTVRDSLPHNVTEAMSTAYHESQDASRNWKGLCDRFVAVTYGLAHSGYASAREHWQRIPRQYKVPGSSTPPPGALVFWDTGPDGHVALSIGGGYVDSTDFKRTGKVDLAAISDISQRWGGLMGWSLPYFAGKTTPLSTGGITNRPVFSQRWQAGEGGPEAILPLNGRGAQVLADTMVRYADQSQVAMARMAPHSTPVNAYYHYDYSNQFSGPVTVQAQDPDEMGRKLEEKARMRRLVQPVGAR